MAERNWNPPHWLVWYGYCMSVAWGFPARTPERNPVEKDLARFRERDVDKALRQLTMDERT